MSTTPHPDGKLCPICGCGSIYYWPELEDWNKFSEKKKREYEICPCCDYGSVDFPYEEFD